MAMPASAPRVLTRGKQVIAVELRGQVDSLGVDGAAVIDLEDTQPAVHQQTSLADRKPMGRLESVALGLGRASSVLGLLVSGASPLV
jgi:hypothetical protein